MGKYAPLTAFLKQQDGREIRISFGEIEQIIGAALPPKAKHLRAWWSNNPSNNVMTKAWLAAGYKTAQVDISGEALVFRPAGMPMASGFGEIKQAKFEESESARGKPPRHPVWGIWDGLVTILPDVDYTEPADPEWEKVYDE
jgi:hypothetical protein